MNEPWLGPLDFEPSELQTRYDLERDRRLRPSGTGQYVGVGGAFARFGADPGADPDFTRDPIVEHTDAVVVGGGYGGLVAGARLRGAGLERIRVVEGASDFGGTWYWNRYPGAMCDIEAHIYMPLLEETGYAPLHRYAYADELFAYAQLLGTKYGLYDLACFQTRVTTAAWDEGERVWRVTTDRADVLTCDYLVIAGGRQSLPKLPRIEGLDTYTGHVFHSSRWDYEFTAGGVHGDLSGLADKRVAIVGTGATAIQVVPAVARDALEVFVLQRTPSAVGPRGNRPTGPDWIDRSEPGWQRRRRENFQNLILGKPQDHDDVGDGWTQFTAMIEATPREAVADMGRPLEPAELELASRIGDFRLMNFIRSRTAELVRDPATADALQPWYRWRCKRPCWHDDYLDAFNRDNVHLLDAGAGFTLSPRGVVVDGSEHAVDCVIFATGFEGGLAYTDLLGFDPVGRGGKTLRQHWTAGTRSWFGMMTDSFPNLFMIGGNQQTAAAFNAIHLVEEQCEHMAFIVRAVRGTAPAEVEPTADEVDRYVGFIAEDPANQRLLDFYAECTPGYFNGEGQASRPEQLFAGARVADPIVYYRMLEDWRQADDMAGLKLTSR